MPADGLYKLSFQQLRDIRGEADARVREGTFVFTLKSWRNWLSGGITLLQFLSQARGQLLQQPFPAALKKAFFKPWLSVNVFCFSVCVWEADGFENQICFDCLKRVTRNWQRRDKVLMCSALNVEKASWYTAMSRDFKRSDQNPIYTSWFFLPATH